MRTKRVLSLLLAVMLLATMCLQSIAFADDQKDETAKKLAQIQTQIDAKKVEVNSAKQAYQTAQNNTKDAKAKLDAAAKQGSLIAEEIDLLEEQMELTCDDMDAIRAKEEEQYQLFCEQVRQEEERGTLSYWSVLFKASSFSDLLSRIDFINEIMEHDNQVMEALQATRAELEEREKSIEEQQVVLDDAYAQQQEVTAQYGAIYQDYKKTEEDMKAAYDEAVAEESALEAAMKEVAKNAEQYGITGGSSGGYIWPVKVSPIYITSKFGPRKAPTAGASTQHNGIDIGVSYVPVYAAKSGTVTLAGTNGGFGNCVIISHGSGYSTTYGHLSTIKVKVGDVVSQGQQIAVSGNSGTSTGPHLDFRIMEGGNYVNPLNYLSGYVMCD